MAGSQPPTYAQYGVEPVCSGCGRRFQPGYENVWFQGLPFPAVWGFSCCALTNRTVKAQDDTG